jgi:three-Cys-motif partner protein
VVSKPYAWVAGAVLEEHTRRKHKILREYFFQYVTVRCQNPLQRKFRLAIVDGFSGAGRYSCGSAGSPIIFLEELRHAVDAVNLQRVDQGLGIVEVECLLIFNDASADAVRLLQENCAPLIADISASCPQIHTLVRYMNNRFEDAYSEILGIIAQGRYKSVLYNLDQCGHSKVPKDSITELMRTAPSVEIFYTFAIQTLLSFLSRTDSELQAKQLRHLGLQGDELEALDGAMSNTAWLGAAEKVVFRTFYECAAFVSPFSIHNPDGWRYWLIHFANSYRARQVYNDVLHDNSSSQAHFGRSGLNMLAYDPSHEAGSLYLFDRPGRQAAKNELLVDIPRLVTESGDAISIADLYGSIYNATPAHKDDIHAALIESTELEVVTPSGGLRRKPNTVDIGDTLKLKNQRSFFPMFLNGSKPQGRS